MGKQSPNAMLVKGIKAITTFSAFQKILPQSLGPIFNGEVEHFLLPTADSGILSFWWQLGWKLTSLEINSLLSGAPCEDLGFNIYSNDRAVNIPH